MALTTTAAFPAVTYSAPTTAWTEHYYNPMEERIAEKTAEWRGIPEAEAVLKEARREISTFHRHSDYFSYAFFVMRR